MHRADVWSEGRGPNYRGIAEKRLCSHKINTSLLQSLYRSGPWTRAPPGITQDEEAFNRFTKTSPHLVRYVDTFLQAFPKSLITDSRTTYHQLEGNMGLRCALNSIRIHDCRVSYCQENLFLLNTSLRNITSGAIASERAAEDILYFPEKGQTR